MDETIRDISDIPHTLSYVIRKRQQIDNLSELPRDKRPPDWIMWHNNPDKLTEWLDDVIHKKDKVSEKGSTISIPISEIEG